MTVSVAVLVTHLSTHSLHLTKSDRVVRAERRPRTEERIPTPRAARLIGIKAPTIAKSSCLGKGPQGWIQVSPTHVIYPRKRSRTFSRRAPSVTRVITEVGR